MLKYPEVTAKIIGAALKVHSAIGPGVLESVYQTCIAYELRSSGLKVFTQCALPVVYQGIRMDSGYRIDLLVEDLVIVELKCVDTLLPIHKAQLLTYLRLANKPIGVLLNFNVIQMRDGIRRILNKDIVLPNQQAPSADESTSASSADSVFQRCFAAQASFTISSYSYIYVPLFPDRAAPTMARPTSSALMA